MYSDNKTLVINDVFGQNRINQLGGQFINGRPLPPNKRIEIIRLHNSGVRPCNISRQLQVSHGCVSKILCRYHETGSISPGMVGGSRPRRVFKDYKFKEKIISIKKLEPDLYANEIRDRLISSCDCLRSQAPSVNAINKILKLNGFTPGRQQQPPATRNVSRRSQLEDSMEANPLAEQQTTTTTAVASKPRPSSFTIDSILGNRAADDEDSQVSTETGSESDQTARRNRTSFSSEQLGALESMFDANKYPDPDKRSRLAQETKLSKDKIQVWFSNRRARWRKSLSASDYALATTTHAYQLPPLRHPHHRFHSYFAPNLVASAPIAQILPVPADPNYSAAAAAAMLVQPQFNCTSLFGSSGASFLLTADAAAAQIHQNFHSCSTNNNKAAATDAIPLAPFYGSNLSVHTRS